MNTMARLGFRLALASTLALPALLPAPLAAQGAAADPHWLPWVGCWQTVGNGDAPVYGTPNSSVCVVPASRAGVEVLTLTDGAVTARDRIEATDAPRPSSEEGCEGTELIQWSNDGHRLFRTTDQRCTGNIERKVSGLLAILPSGEWLNAQSVTVAGNTSMRVLRYRPVTDLSGFPAEVTRGLQGQRLAIEAARGSAAATPTTRDIVETSNRLGDDVAGAWLIERGQGFAVDADKLVALADAGVPSSVIDVMIALSYPDRFAIDHASGETEMRPDEDGRRGRVGMRSEWGYDPIYGYGYPPYRYGYGYGYGWGWGGGGYYNGYYDGYYGRPVVIIRDPGSGSSGSRGRAVNGKGYTRSGDSGSARTPSRPTTTRSSGDSGSSSSGGARSSGGSSGSGTSTGRTAKPRDGG
jgi:hypothetical protein